MQLALDLEYLGRDDQVAVVSIGVAIIGGASASWQIDPVEACSHGSTDPETIKWWASQSEAARGELKGTLTTFEALQAVGGWLQSHGWDDESTVWGKGPAIDCTILKNACARVGIAPFWMFWQERCVRTILQMVPEANQLPFEGTPHRAEDDARHEARQVEMALRKVGAL